MPDKKNIHIIASQHLDVAWLWKRYPDGEELMRQCFERAVEMIEAFPDAQFVFSRSTVWSFYIVEKKYPELFQKVRQYVEAGRIELCGGQWIEPDQVIPDGESLVRQCLYGQRYFIDTFGKTAAVCWDPDIFGHSASLPQILKKSGMDGYYFHRCRPINREGLPLHQFMWQGLDGTRIFVLSGLWVGKPGKENIQRAIEEMNVYGTDSTHIVTGILSDRRITMQLDWVNAPDEINREVDNYRCGWSSASEVLYDMKSYSGKLPVVKGELGFQFAGTYTSNSAIKSANRKLEALLMNTEKLCSWAMLNGLEYPSGILTDIWRDLCMNQFHDIICGCCHEEVHQEALKLYSGIEERLTVIYNEALIYLAKHVKIDLKLDYVNPIVVFNTLSWARRDPVFLPCDTTRPVQFFTGDGTPLPTQSIFAADKQGGAVFLPNEIPGCGYDVYFLKYGDNPFEGPGIAEGCKLENQMVLVEIDAETGAMKRLYNKQTGLDMFVPGTLGNRLVFYEDRSDNLTLPLDEWKHQSMQAWNIGYTGKILDPGIVERISVIEYGPVRGRIRVERKVQLSRHLPSTLIIQDIILYAHSPVVYIETSGDWQAEEVMLKAEFEMSFAAGKTACEIPYGTIERTIGRHGDSPTTAANSEEDGWNSRESFKSDMDYPMQKWMDYSDDINGIAFLNNGRYGYNVEKTKIGISLLRAPYMSEGELLGLGEFSFTYALMPHSGDWRAANLPKQGYSINNSLIPVIAEQNASGRIQKPLIGIDEQSNVLIIQEKSRRCMNVICWKEQWE